MNFFIDIPNIINELFGELNSAVKVYFGPAILVLIKKPEDIEVFMSTKAALHKYANVYAPLKFFIGTGLAAAPGILQKNLSSTLIYM